ncbi:MAG: methyltransferase type 11 [Pseudomonadota bacterium]
MRAAVATICALSALLAACDGDGVRITTTSRPDHDGKKGVLKVIDTLQCPQTMGVLTRKGSAQAGGTICTYVGPRGAEVTLHLIALEAGDDVDDVLKLFEDRLTRDMPSAAEAIANGQREAARAEAESARAEAHAEQADAEAAKADAQAARAEASASQSKSAGDTAHVRLPGLSVDAQGDKANVRIGPIHIRADDSDANVNISGDGETVNIQAHDDGAEIRTRESGGATRATWLLTDGRRSQDGWRSVGYQARGPEGGPIVLVTVRTKERNHDRVFDAAGDLISLNVGD